MSNGLNKVLIIGNLGADPEIKYTQAGSPVANLSIATSERWKDKTTGEQKEQVEWHRVVIPRPKYPYELQTVILVVIFVSYLRLML